jgi:hypothetical protein
MNLRASLILWLVCAAASLAALLFILFFPTAWASLVDKENNYWVRRGWFSSAFAEKIKKLEKGITVKIMLAIIILLSLVIVSIRLSGPHPHFKALLPPKPKPVLPSRPTR